MNIRTPKEMNNTGIIILFLKCNSFCVAMCILFFSCSVAVMTSSATSTDSRHWPSVVLGKIRSLWSVGSSSANTGLNQLVSGTVHNFYDARLLRFVFDVALFLYLHAACTMIMCVCLYCLISMFHITFYP